MIQSLTCDIGTGADPNVGKKYRKKKNSKQSKKKKKKLERMMRVLCQHWNHD